MFVNDIVDVPVPSPLAAAIACILKCNVPVVNDMEFCGNVTNPLALFPVPSGPGSPLVEYEIFIVTAPALVCELVIAVAPLPFANCIVIASSTTTVSPKLPDMVLSPGAVVHFVEG